MAIQPSSFLSTAFNAVTRMPVIFAGLNATLLTGETAMRVIGTGLGYLGFNGDTKIANVISDKLPEVTFNLMRPFKNMSHRELGISLLACTVITAIGWEICNKLLGAAPNTYNQVNQFISPVKLDVEWRHPFVEYAVSFLPASAPEPKKD